MSLSVPMHSVKLAQRLARHTIATDPFNLNSDVALDVLNAINAGLATYYRLVPGAFKRTTLSHTVRGPRTIPLVFTAQYSRLVADDSFVVRDQGCTVRFANGSSDNVVTGPNSLLDNYLRTDLNVDGTLYSDAVPIQDVIERVIGHLLLYSNSQSSPTPVARNERLRAGRSTQMRVDDGQDYYSFETNLSTIGRPRFYWLDPMGVSQGAEPEFVLRLAPLPDVDYTIRMEAELSTQRLIFADLNTPREIYVPSNCLDDILIPLCEAALTSSPFWSDKTSIDRFMKAKETAIENIKLMPSDIAEGANFIGTPPGF